MRSVVGAPATILLFFSLLPAVGVAGAENRAPVVAAQGAPLNVERVADGRLLARIDVAIEAAIANGDLPGAVVLVERGGLTLYHEAFGHRSVEPSLEPMTRDTVFDLASLTKVVATTTAVMMLVEEGRIRLRDPVSRYVSGFERYGKDDVRIEHLLTHVSGLRPDFPLEDEFDGADVAITRLVDERLLAAPGQRFVYSDLNFIALGEVVARVSGMPLDEFTTTRIFRPLGMNETRFTPGPSRRARIAPTERCRRLGWPCGSPEAPMLRGVVHDPTARRMGGVAGHAGLFAPATDLARFSRMLLNGGTLDGVRVLSEMSVARMTRVATPPAVADRRGLGWDIDSRFSSNRGALFRSGSYGHTGFTGTSLWIDPDTETAVIFLSNRVHPLGAGQVTELRGRVATLAAAALQGVALEADDQQPVKTGIDRLRDEEFVRLVGARVALLTNQTGRTRDGVTTIDLLNRSPVVDLRRLFSPEHGIRGNRDDVVADGVDPITGLRVHSLYGERRRPTADQLDGIDTVVVDLQDAGARFFTYATTMAYVMEEAAKQSVRVVVLDRPNPIGGTRVEGPLLDDQALGFTGYLSMPIRHGVTLGELARVFQAELGLAVELDVVPMVGWRRALWYDETELTWINPSPNLRSVGQAVLYPGIGAFEGTNVSVGRGTDTPFELVGAPWVDGPALARALNARRVAGVRFYPVEFTPRSSKFANERSSGVRIMVTNRDALQPVRVGLEIAAALYGLHPDAFEIEAAARLLGSRLVIERITRGDDPKVIAESWEDDEREWRRRIAPYLLYP